MTKRCGHLANPAPQTAEAPAPEAVQVPIAVEEAILVAEEVHEAFAVADEVKA